MWVSPTKVFQKTKFFSIFHKRSVSCSCRVNRARMKASWWAERGSGIHLKYWMPSYMPSYLHVKTANNNERAQSSRTHMVTFHLLRAAATKLIMLKYVLYIPVRPANINRRASKSSNEWSLWIIYCMRSIFTFSKLQATFYSSNNTLKVHDFDSHC